jgi:glycosyltransferase involved in cell wall biosynthesis
MAARLLVVCDQLPHPVRNGITLPLGPWLDHLRHYADLGLLWLRAPSDEPDQPDYLTANVERFGPVSTLDFERLSYSKRIAAEFKGLAMFQHGWVPRDPSEARAALAGWQGATVLVSPVRALARWQSLLAAVPGWTPRRTVAALHDCTTAEYRNRWRSPQLGPTGALKAATHLARSPLVARIEARMLRHVDAVLLQTPADLDAMRTLVGADAAAKVALAPNGVREDLFSLQPGADDSRVLFVADLGGEYAPIASWLLACVWPRVRAAVPGASLTIIGRNAPLALREAMAVAAGVQHHEYAADLAPLYASSRVVLSPLWKGFGLINKTLEGLAAGRAVVGGRAAFNGIDGFESGRDGLALASTAAQPFADAVASLLADPEGAAQMGREGRTRVRNFQWAVSAERVRDALWQAHAVGPRHDLPSSMPAALETS